MDETTIVLQTIREQLRQVPSDIVGDVSLPADVLSVLGGTVRLRAIVHRKPSDHPAVAHAHLIAEISGYDPLDACLVGIHPERREALAEVGRVWASLVAGPILSLVHARPVLGATHFDGSQLPGVLGCHGFLGPLGGRSFGNDFSVDAFSELPVFDFAAELAPPRALHIAKVTLMAQGEGRWNRNLEIDGHEATATDAPWIQAGPVASQGIVVQFAVFHFADQPDWVERRRQADDAIQRYVTAVRTTESLQGAIEVLAKEGASADLIEQLAAFVPMACARLVFASAGVPFSPVYVRVKRDGSLEELALMHQPVFARSLLICGSLMAGELQETVKNLALSSAELHAVNNALNAGSKLENLQPVPAIIPDPDASDEVIARAVKELQQRRRK
jgi:hypothetical protein